MSSMLLAVDPQYDFINGALPVPGAASAMDALADYLLANNGKYSLKLVTCDWHPPKHCSFACEGGEWPVHCLQHGAGAAIWTPLLQALHQTSGETHILEKGADASREEYSIFRTPGASEYIERIIADNNIDHVDICGIAGDICALNTLQDGVAMFGKDIFRVMPEFSPSLDGGFKLQNYCRESLNGSNH